MDFGFGMEFGNNVQNMCFKRNLKLNATYLFVILPSFVWEFFNIFKFWYDGHSWMYPQKTKYISQNDIVIITFLKEIIIYNY